MSRVAAKSKGKCTTFPYVTTICFVLFRVVSCSRPVSSVHGAPRPGRRVRRAWRVRLRLLRGPQRAAGPCSARCACTSQTERGEGGGSAVRLGVVLFPRRCLFRRCRIFRCSEFSGWLSGSALLLRLWSAGCPRERSPTLEWREKRVPSLQWGFSVILSIVPLHASTR